MMKNWIISRAFRRLWNELCRLFADIVFLKERDKLFIYSWMSYEKGRMVHNNWGDDINKYFLESVSSLKVNNIRNSLLYSVLPVHGYTCIGSLIGNFKAKNYDVWGTGIIELNHNLLSKPNKVFSVRGPLTRDELLKNGINCPENYGDPALLISRYYRNVVDKEYTWGIIPHYTDEENPALIEFCNNHPEVLLISMRNYMDWHEIPDKIMNCHRIISSSLHGLIIADSYGVKNIWVRFSEGIKGGDFKYQDYFQSVGRQVDGPVVINNQIDLENIIINDNTSRAYNIDYKSIYEACPFKEKILDFRDIVPSLPSYNSLEEKNSQYCESYYIKTEAELDKKLLELETAEQELIFRGIYDARYKMYASSQRHWSQKSDRVLPLGTSNYYQTIKRLISLTKNCPEVITYQSEQKYSDNDMYILALMQHFGMPSPMIDFTLGMRKGLFFAVDGMPEWVDNDTDNLEDYVSLYYINRNIDWISGSAQKTMKYGGETVDNMVAELLEKEPDIKLDVEETLDNFKHLTYSQFIPKGELYDIKFMPVNGAEIGVSKVNIPSLNFTCGYMISNDRILAQDGMFILNNTIDQPLVEVMNKQSNRKFVCCLNIRKNLVPYIWERHLKSYNINHKSVYCEDVDAVMLLQDALNMI